MSEPSSGPVIRQDIGQWVVEMSWAASPNQAGPSEIVIRPADPKNVPVGGLSSTVLREVDFRSATQQMRELHGATNQFLETIRLEQAEGLKPIDLVREALSEGITATYLSLLSIQYLTYINQGQEKPVDRLADELGKSLQTVKGHLWKARKLGLLTGSAGRKGGEITEKARTIVVDFGMRRNVAPRAADSE